MGKFGHAHGHEVRREVLCGIKNIEITKQTSRKLNNPLSRGMASAVVKCTKSMVGAILSITLKRENSTFLLK